MSPNFRVSLVTKVTGRRCGSSCIDDYFIKSYLPNRLTQEEWMRLQELGHRREQHGSATHEVLRRGEQMLLAQFITMKHNFAGWDENNQPSETDWVDLPHVLDARDDMRRNIENNRLGITW